MIYEMFDKQSVKLNESVSYHDQVLRIRQFANFNSKYFACRQFLVHSVMNFFYFTH